VGVGEVAVGVPVDCAAGGLWKEAAGGLAYGGRPCCVGSGDGGGDGVVGEGIIVLFRAADRHEMNYFGNFWEYTDAS